MKKLLLIAAIVLPLQGCSGLACGLCALHRMLDNLPPPADQADKPQEP
jgi:hypothetical protein